MKRHGGFLVGVLLLACGSEGGLKPPPEGATGGRSGGAGGSSGRSSAGTGGAAAPPAQGAVTYKTGVAPGKVCAQTHSQLSAPLNIAGVLQALNCDLSMGCKPDEFVVADGDRGASVTCAVVPSGGNGYDVSARLNVDGTSTGVPSISFGVSGLLSPTGGTASIAQQNSISQRGGTDDACTVVISAPRGLVKPGGIWASFQCGSFRNPTDISETGCVVEGIFLFENCD